MKIDSASYSLQSSHQAYSRDEKQETLRQWTGNRRPDSATPVSLSDLARASLAADIASAAAVAKAQQSASQASAIEDAFAAAADDPFIRLIKFMIEMLTGKTIQLFSAQDLGAMPPAAVSSAAPQAPQQQPQAKTAGFGLEYDYHAVHEEFEQTRVSAQGIIKTQDGQEISFKLDLSMTRETRVETSASLRAGDAQRKDPLVLNFDGTAAQLSDASFAFDLGGQGKKLAALTGGSGYLAIDRNHNGKIDSGSELFGPATNSGFGELAVLDSDGNGWIDENDAAFKALRVWTPDAKGDGALDSLASRKVGAIAVGHVASPFELRGSGNSNLGAIAASGLFVKEDGSVGTVQEVDLTV